MKNTAFVLTSARNFNNVSEWLENVEVVTALFCAETRMNQDQPFSAVAIASEIEALEIFNQF